MSIFHSKESLKLLFCGHISLTRAKKDVIIVVAFKFPFNTDQKLISKENFANERYCYL